MRGQRSDWKGSTTGRAGSPAKLVPRADKFEIVCRKCVWRIRISGQRFVSGIPIDGFEQLSTSPMASLRIVASIYNAEWEPRLPGQATRVSIYRKLVSGNAPTIGAETHLPFAATKPRQRPPEAADRRVSIFVTKWKSNIRLFRQLQAGAER